MNLRPFSILLFAPMLAGCPQLETMEGKPRSQEALEYRQALLVPEADEEPPAEPVFSLAMAPEPEPEPEPIIEPEPPAPPACVPVFRIIACDEDGREIIL